MPKLWRPRQSQPTWRQLPQQRHRFFFPECDCCGEDCNCEPFCDSSPLQWEITIAGVTDNNCTLCDPDYNGTFILDCVLLNCIWITAELSTCSVFGPNGERYAFRPFTTGGGVTYWTLLAWGTQSSTSAIAVWEIADASFDCMGDNVLTSGSTFFGALNPFQVSRCSNWPATVTISPA